MGEVLLQHAGKKISATAYNVIATFLVVINVFAMYSCSFEGTKPYKCNSQIKCGIFKGLIDTPENARRYETIYKDLAEVRNEDDKTITCGPYAMEFYLMTDLKPNAANLWDPNNTDLLFKYYDSYYGEPDMIIMHDSVAELTNPVFLNFVANNYRLIQTTDGFYIFHKK